MALEYLALDLSQTIFDTSVQPINRRAFRNMENPFELSEKDFKKLYRLTPESTQELIHQLDGDLRGSRITALSTEKQVLAALRFFATGCYQRPVGEQWGISMSQPSISRCIHRVTNAINKNLYFPNVKFPIVFVYSSLCFSFYG
ncbi:uncharacterized protein LOC131994969 [Stomoxys calcitrans]|uniref:uncharacterized protein LOC131994969 n=1 Tax=Stomoxys calcitrans TaxID=35570 RepID=UPI0027E24004|nr:uncharacterized protein LOC131994969 [Stomoxys calcitrans]